MVLSSFLPAEKNKTIEMYSARLLNHLEVEDWLYNYRLPLYLCIHISDDVMTFDDIRILIRK